MNIRDSWRRMGAVAAVTARGMMGRPGKLLWWCLLAVVAAALGPLWRAWPDVGLGLLGQCFDASLPYVIYLGGAYMALRACTAVSTQVRQRLLGALWARPLCAWEYLLGQVAAYVGAYLLATAIVWVLADALMWWGAVGPLARDRWLQLCQVWEFVVAAVVLLPLAAVSTPLAASVFYVLCQLLPSGLAAWAAGRQDAAAVLGRWLAYLGPVQLPQHFSILACCALADRLVYGAFIFWACAWVFERRDVPLREA